MEFLVVVLLLVLIVQWIVIRNRFHELHRRIEELSSRRDELPSEAALRELGERIDRLERLILGELPVSGRRRGGAAADLARPAPVEPETVLPTPPPVPAPQPPEPVIPSVTREPPSLVEAVRERARAREAQAAPGPTAVQSVLAGWSQRLREQLAGEEWEAVVGGSWLNKLGVLVLVIGISLFLGYSLAHLGPAGRVAIGFAVSGTMLGGGVVLERRVRYVIFARGLIGGGWAALYFTTYATHGLEAARIVRDPLLGMVLLGAVAVGMILHSLHYRSEAVTGIAYFVGFATLVISPVSGFALVASVPLAGSLLVVARRFSWDAMAVAGVVLTYAVYAVRYGTEVSTAALFDDFVSGQTVLAVYWVFFEIFDLLETAGRRREPGLARTIFPLNTCGFVGVSLLQWSSVTPATLYIFFAGAAAAYIFSTIARARLRPPSSFPEEADGLTRARSGGYEGAVTVAVALATPAIFLRFSGLTTNVALLLEAEFLCLAGLRLDQAYLRKLGAVVFVLPVLKLVFYDVKQGGDLVLVGMTLMAWTPVALLTVAILYLNRGLVRLGNGSPPLPAELGYSYTASALAVLVLAFEVPRDYVGLAWLLLALPLFEIGLRKRLAELRSQAYGVGGLGVVTLLALSGLGIDGGVARLSWVSLCPAGILTYAAASRLYGHPPDGLADWERVGVRDVSSAAGTALMTAWLWHLLPTSVVAVGWGVLGLVLIEVGIAFALPLLRLQAYLVAALAFGTLSAVNVFGVVSGAGPEAWLSLAPAAALAYVAAARAFGLLSGRVPERERVGVRDVSSAAGTTLLAAWLWHLLPTPVVAVAWGVLTLLLVEVGAALPLTPLKLQGHLVAGLVFVRLLLANFTGTGETAGVSHRILTVLPLIVLFYYLSARLRREAAGERLLGWEHGLHRLYLYAPAVLAVLLIRFELGRVLAVVGWALLGLGLLYVGIRWDNRDLRWQSYVLAFLAFVRAWATNFYIPESLAGAAGRVVTGATVIGSFYAAQLLSPRGRDEAAPTAASWFTRAFVQGDRHARSVFSVLATILLAVLLFYEVSGRLLTVAWGLQGILVAVAGFLLRERVLRVSGLVLLGVCILKVFVYDLRELDALARILSFVVLGLVLLAVSLVYTRFRERLRRYL